MPGGGDGGEGEWGWGEGMGRVRGGVMGGAEGARMGVQGGYGTQDAAHNADKVCTLYSALFVSPVLES